MHRSTTGWRKLLALALTLSFFAAGCGGDGQNDEVVYLYVFNGYPGTQSMTVYGPTGPIVSNLAFGERSPEPVEVDRNVGTDIMIVLDGAPQTFDGSLPLFSLYPGETGTLFVSRRTTGNVNFATFRHIQSISENCRAVFGNGLSLEDGDLAAYNFIVGWDFGDHGIAAAGFTSGDPRVDDNPNFLNQVANYPYFFLVPMESDEEGESVGYGFVWVGTEAMHDFPTINFASGSMTAHPPTAVVQQCLDELAEPDPTDAEAMMEHQLAEAECKARRNFTAQTYGPGLQNIGYTHYNPRLLGDSSNCDQGFRIFSDFANIFNGQHGFGNGSYVDINAEFGSSDHFFAVLYGRPVGPLLETWRSSDFESGGGFEPLPDYPGGAGQ